MTGKPLTRNLKQVVETLLLSAIPVYTFDRNQEKVLPCITIGYNSETTSFAGNNHGHYTVGGYVNVEYQGYEDIDNQDADSTANSIVNCLIDRNTLSLLNKPLTGTDTRSLTGFHCNGLVIRGIDREIEDTSMNIIINFDAFNVPVDL